MVKTKGKAVKPRKKRINKSQVSVKEEHSIIDDVMATLKYAATDKRVRKLVITTKGDVARIELDVKAINIQYIFGGIDITQKNSYFKIQLDRDDIESIEVYV